MQQIEKKTRQPLRELLTDPNVGKAKFLKVNKVLQNVAEPAVSFTDVKNENERKKRK